MTITAAVDGSSLGNPGPAGWAWVISEDCWDAGGWPSGTNNLGELNAVLELLKATAQAGLADEDLHILADSQYAINDGRVIPRGPGFASPAESTATEFEPSTPTAEAASAGREIPGNATDVQTPEEALEHQFLDAWLRADSHALKALEAPGCMRIWHNGSLTQGLEGRAPEHVECSNFQVSRVQSASDHHNTAESDPDAWVITYVLTWTGGKLRESSTWVTGENGPRILMHQSSPISAR